MLYWVLSGIALVFSLSGNILVNFKHKTGFIIWILSNIFWIAVNILQNPVNGFQIIMFSVYICLNIHGFINWTKDSKGAAGRNGYAGNG